MLRMIIRLRLAIDRLGDRQLLYFVSLVLFVSVLFFVRLGHRELYSSHEARAAQNAQRMLDTGEWGLPVLFDGQSDFQKPPGYYWLVALCGWFNGGEVDAFAVRFPAALAGLLTALMLFWFVKNEGRGTAAFVAAIGLATAVHFTAIARTARIDVPLTCAVSASLLAFYRGCRSESHYLYWHIASAVAAAIGVMLKGPIALALIGPVAVAWLFVERNRTAPRLSFPSASMGILVLVLIAAPWFLWANSVTDGKFARVFFWHHNVDRFTGSSQTLASHPWWHYLPRFAVDFLPWTPTFAVLAVWSMRSGHWREDRLFRFGVVWLVVMFAILSLAKFKRADYLLPLYPGAALMFGSAADAWLISRSDLQTVRRAKWAFALAVGLVAVGWQVMSFAIEPAEQAKEEKGRFAAMIRHHAPPPHTVLLFRTESHLLALRLGRPLHTLVEWKELNDLLAEPGPHFVVMPPDYVYPAQQIVTSRRLTVVARLEDFTPDKPPRPLVFLRTAD